MSRLRNNRPTGALHARAAERARRATERAAARATRRRALPRWAERARRYGLVAGSGLVGLAVVAGLWLTGWLPHAAARVQAGLVQLTVDAGFAVAEVLVEGRSETHRAEIMAVLDLARGAPILTFDPARARDDLERLPWVATAVVERRLPDTIYIRLVEREPMAFWQKDRKLMLIDRHGVVLTDRDLNRFAHLPVLVGENAPRHAPELLALLKAEPSIAARVEAAVWVGDRRWDLRLDNGIDVRLPETGVAAALRQLAELEARHLLIDRDIVAIDLRLPDRLIVQTSAAAAERRRAPEEKI